MTRWLVTRLALLVVLAGYVTVQLGAPTQVVMMVLAIGLATLAGLLATHDEIRQRATLAAATLVLAVLHARVLAADAAWLGLQLGLAAAIAQSAAVSLAAERLHDRGGIVVVVGLVATALVIGPALPEHGARALVPTLIFGTLAALRPLGALGAAFAAAGLNDGERDPMLWWRAEPTLLTEARR